MSPSLAEVIQCHGTPTGMACCKSICLVMVVLCRFVIGCRFSSLRLWTSMELDFGILGYGMRRIIFLVTIDIQNGVGSTRFRKASTTITREIFVTSCEYAQEDVDRCFGVIHSRW